MSAIGGPNVVEDGLVLALDAANIKSFRGDPTTNTIVFPGAGAGRYNNPSFSGTIINTGQTFKGSPIWEVTFIPQDSGRVPRLGSTEGFGFLHSMGTRLFPDTRYMSSVYVRSEYPLQQSTNQFINTYSNIPGWGANGTDRTRLQEGIWTRLYSRYYRNLVIDNENYIDRNNTNTLNVIVNTTQLTQVLLTITVNSNGTFLTQTDYGTSTAGGVLLDFANHSGIRSANPSIINNGGISGLSTGTSAIVNHGLNSSTWTKLSNLNPIFKPNYPFQYYVLLNIPSTSGNDTTITLRPNFGGFYSSVSDSKFWKITFDVSNLQVNDVIKTYWTAPMLEQHNRDLPSKFVIGTRGTTVETGGGWVDRSGNNNHGELVNGPIFNSDNLGSIEFDGVNDYVVSSHRPNTVNGYSHGFWFKSNTNSQSRLSEIRDTSKTGNPLIGFVLNFTSVNKLAFLVRGSDGVRRDIFITQNILNNDWHYLVGQIRIDGITELYLNGDKITESNLTVNLNINLNDVGFVIGCRNLEGNIDAHFNGNISQTLIYNRALSAEEVLQNFNATKGRYGL
jgi:hypothetical protein